MKSYTDLEVDISGLTDAGKEIGATGKQVKFALCVPSGGLFPDYE